MSLRLFYFFNLCSFFTGAPWSSDWWYFTSVSNYFRRGFKNIAVLGIKTVTTKQKQNNKPEQQQQKTSTCHETYRRTASLFQLSVHFLKSKWSNSFISVKYYMCTCTVKQLHLPLSSDSSCWKRPCSPFPSLPLLLFPHFHLLTYTPFHFVYSDIGSFHTTPEEYENAAALSLRLGQPSTLIHHENKAFRKRSSNIRNFSENAVFLFSCGR